jgi:sensor histidine kinase YesM
MSGPKAIRRFISPFSGKYFIRLKNLITFTFMSLSENQRLKITPSQVFLVVFAYIFASWVYHATIWSTSYDEKWKTMERLFGPKNWWDGGGLQYAMMLLATAVIWFFIFYLFKHWQVKYRLLLHLIGLPLFVFSAWKGYYFVSEIFGMGHLGGNAQYWDVYIPALVYFVQFGIFHFYEHYVINQKRLQYEIELKNLALKNELSAIKAQLNPHFLYNVFNTINASIPEDQEETREMIASLSDLFRYQLRASQQDLVRLEEELAFVKKYLELEKSRFGERLNIEIEVNEALLNRKIPPMLLQPLVENAVKHGISPKIEGGNVLIKIEEKNEKLQFTISDTGVGVSENLLDGLFSKGVGLGNTEKRLKKLYGTGIQLLQNIPQGLTVQFAI